MRHAPPVMRRTVRSKLLTQSATLLFLAVSAGCSQAPLDPEPLPGMPDAVATVEITPDTAQLVVGTSRAFSAVLRAQGGRILGGKAVVWRSSDAAVARVDDSGNVTALGEGLVTITATSEGKQAETQIRVVPPPPPPAVGRISITGGDVEIEPGQSLQLTARIYAADGTELLGRSVKWTSSDSAVVRVHPAGRVDVLRGGTATITARSEGITGSTALRIPEWLILDLESADDRAVPVVLSVTADTVQQSGDVTVVRERRLRLTEGRVWTSTVDARYRQLYRLEITERLVTNFEGGTIVGEDAIVEQRVIRDEGDCRMYDMWTGEPICKSSSFTGHQFRVQRYLDGSRAIRQALPGEGPASYLLVFAR